MRPCLALFGCVLLLLPACLEGGERIPGLHTRGDGPAGAGASGGPTAPAPAPTPGTTPGSGIAPAAPTGAVYVSIKGDDGAPGTQAAPKRTFAAGYELAESLGLPVKLSSGEFDATTLSRIKVAVEGGFDPDTWQATTGASTVLGVEDLEVRSPRLDALILENVADGHVEFWGTSVADGRIVGGHVSVRGEPVSFTNVQVDSDVEVRNSDLSITDSVLAFGADLSASAHLHLERSVVHSVLRGGYFPIALEVSQSASVFAHNTVLTGDLDADQSSRATLLHCVLEGGARAVQSAELHLINTILVGGLYDNRASTPIRMAGVLWAHPQNTITDAGFADDAYHLAPDSPAIDIGVDPSDYGFEVAPDIDGDPRPAGGGFDAGIDELP